MNYQNTLLLIMELNNYSMLPDYPFTLSLNEVPNNSLVESYCRKVLSNLQELVNINS